MAAAVVEMLEPVREPMANVAGCGRLLLLGHTHGAMLTEAKPAAKAL
jgi:hypothetical protein